jgi:L-asparaginase
MFDPFPLAEVIRSGKTESIHYGHAVVLSTSGIQKQYGNADFNCYTRSIIKPIQAKISYDLLGRNLQDQFLALACASHTSQPAQIEILKNFAEHFKIDISCLQCGFDPKYPDSRLHHNCAGKHLLVVSACMHAGLAVNSYLDFNHPIQIAIHNELIRLLRQDPKTSIYRGVDGCGLPTYYLSIKQMAEIFLALIQDPSYQPLINAMINYPELVGGPEQIDSLIMKSSPGNFLAKGGAESLMMIANLNKKEVLIIKIVDGSNRAKAFISSNLLKDLGWMDIKIPNSMFKSQLA